MLPAAIRGVPKTNSRRFSSRIPLISASATTERLAPVTWTDTHVVTHPFVPHRVAFARREVVLEPCWRASGGPSTAGVVASDSRRSLVCEPIRPGDWIVRDRRESTSVADRASEQDERSPEHRRRACRDTTQALFPQGQGGEMEALYYRRLIAKVLPGRVGLYLLNLLGKFTGHGER